MAIGREKANLPTVEKRPNPGRRGGLIPHTKEAWAAVLATCDGRVAEVARRYQYSRTYIYRVMHAFDLPVAKRHTGNWGDLTD